MSEQESQEYQAKSLEIRSLREYREKFTTDGLEEFLHNLNSDKIWVHKDLRENASRQTAPNLRDHIIKFKDLRTDEDMESFYNYMEKEKLSINDFITKMNTVINDYPNHVPQNMVTSRKDVSKDTSSKPIKNSSDVMPSNTQERSNKNTTKDFKQRFRTMVSSVENTCKNAYNYIKRKLH